MTEWINRCLSSCADAGEVRQLLRAGQRVELYPVVPSGGRLRVPPLWNRRPRPPQEWEIPHRLPSRGNRFVWFIYYLIWFDLIFFVACYADFNVGLVLFPPRTDEFQSASCGFQMSLRVRSMGSVAPSFKPLPTPRFTALFFGTVSEQFQSSCSYFGTVSCINEHDLSLFQWIWVCIMDF